MKKPRCSLPSVTRKSRKNSLEGFFGDGSIKREVLWYKSKDFQDICKDARSTKKPTCRDSKLYCPSTLFISMKIKTFGPSFEKIYAATEKGAQYRAHAKKKGGLSER